VYLKLLRYSVIVFLLLCSEGGFAAVKIYLLPRVEVRKNSICMSDISRIDGRREPAAAAGNISISKKLYSDGYIDWKEVSGLLKKHISEPVLIYGNSVRIIKKKDSTIADFSESGGSDVQIRSGERIILVVKRKGIRVETSAIAENEGRNGDLIYVRTGRSKRLRCRIIDSKQAELEI